MVTLQDRAKYWRFLNPGIELELQNAGGEDFVLNAQPVSQAELEEIPDADVDAWLAEKYFLDKMKAIEDEIDRLVDRVAGEKGYGTISMSPTAACMTYAGYSNEYQSEGEAFGQWKASLWPVVYQIRDAFLAGLRPEPTPEEVISELPTMVWPE